MFDDFESRRLIARARRASVAAAMSLTAALILTACGGAAPAGGASSASGPGFPVALNRGVDGEVWGLGGSTAVEIGDYGRVERSVDLDFLPSPWTISALAVGPDDRLFLGAVWSDGGAFGDIIAYDVATGEHAVRAHQDNPVGDLVVIGDDVVFVSFATDDHRSFTVRRANPSGEVSDLAVLPGDGRRASIGADAAGTVVVTTGGGVTRLSTTGATLGDWPLPTGGADLAVSREGRMLVATRDGASCVEWFRVDATGPVPLDGPCDASSFVWMDEETVLVSAGDENGAELVRMAAQSSPSGR
jgi:hypothetical protein